MGEETAGSFSLYFDGEDVGRMDASENIDNISLTLDGKIAIGTAGNVSVPGVTAVDEDLLRFRP